MVLYDRRDVIQDVGVRDARGRLLPDRSVAVADTSDASVVQVSETGWACVASGDAVVTLQVDEVRHPVQVRCLLVDAIEVSPTRVEAVLPAVDGVAEMVEVPALQVKVLDDAGRPLDVPIRVQSQDDRVVRVGPDDGLELRAFGSTELQVVAGEQQVSVPVLVGQTWRDQSLAVVEGGRESITLPPGAWRWTLSADAPVIAAAGTCRDVGADLERECVLPDGGDLVLSSRVPGIRRVALRIERLPELSTP